MRGKIITLAALAMIGVWAGDLRAGICPTDVCVRMELDEQIIVEGGYFSVNIVADINVPVVGWGIDLRLTPESAIALAGLPSIGSAWVPSPSADGDGLAALAFPNAITGNAILLATVDLQAISIGDAELSIETTIGDLTEGFARDPMGFASLTATPAHVTVIPEPAAFALLCFAGLLRRPRKM
ncbi:hypothetical protein B7486_06110 [cyanobacterium TDX16]|nr:hypothetical protein B7486_06110 [cyanobacterium TDX16]